MLKCKPFSAVSLTVTSFNVKAACSKRLCYVYIISRHPISRTVRAIAS